MKKAISLFTLFLSITINSIAQSPQAFKYQAIARNSSGLILANQNVGFKVSLIQGTATGSVVYTEEHNSTTNSFGLVNMEIGNGTNPTNIFANINWVSGPYFIKIEFDATGGIVYADMGTTQLLSVPYALFAASGNQGPQGTIGATGATGPQGIQGNAGTGLNNRGNWISGTSYINGDYVFHRSTNDSLINSMWICQSSSSFISTIKPYLDNTNWVEFQAPSGPQGIQGIIGATGVQGLIGLTGTTGAQGFIGLTGITGATGVQGLIGLTGVTGATGIQGPIGLNGTTGLNGVTGPQGLMGLIGATGADGALTAWSKTGNAGTNFATNFIGTTDANDFVFKSNNSEKMRITSIGNIGIGTTNPITALHINGTLSITDDSEGFGKILTSDVNGSTSWKYPPIWTSSGTQNYIAKFTSDSTLGNSLFYENGSYLGLGTTSPFGRFVIKGDSLSSDSVPLFEVKDKTGSTVFVVWPEGVHVYVRNTTGLAKTNNRGSFAVSGKSNSKANGIIDYFNILPDSSAQIINPSEARIIWYPKKEAFLTGRVLIEHADSIGTNSMATGFESKAIGSWSQAFGYKAIARGDYSTAIGKNAVAKSMNSFAFGDGANAINLSSYAFGAGAVASGTGSYALGSQGIDTLGNVSSNFTIASGNFSMAFGQGSQATNIGSMSFGIKNLSSGKSSQAFGYNTTASGTYSTSMGNSCIASGYSSMSFGEQNTAGGYYSTAFGAYNTSTGHSSTAIGIGNIASGNYSLASGYLTIASGENTFSQGMLTKATYLGSVALGGYTKASGKYSLAAGFNTATSADYATSMGVSTNANSFASLVIGRYNDTTLNNLYGQYNWYDTDPLFVCGNGEWGALSNAFTILKNGNTGVGKVYPNEKLDVAGNIRLNDNTLYLRAGTETKYGLKYIDNFAGVPISGPLLYSYFGGALAAIGPDIIALKWNSSGNLLAPVTYNSSVGATNRVLYIDNTGLIGYLSSSLKYKKNICDMENVDWLYKLRPVNYTYKNDSLNIKQYGLIAEETEKINPLFVSYNPDGSIETVSYSSFISPMLKVLQDQKKVNDKQQKQIDTLLKENEQLKSDNTELKSNVQEIDKLKAEIEKIKSIIGTSAKK